MTFMERLMNTLFLTVYPLLQYGYIRPKMEAILDEYFPEVVGQRPSLEELEREAGLAFQFGHPLIMVSFQLLTYNIMRSATT